MAKKPTIGRPRKRELAWMPPHVERQKSGYWYRNRSIGENHKLCGPDASKAEVWAAHDKLIAGPDKSVLTMINDYFDSTQFTSKKPNTRHGYTEYAKRLRRSFGHFPPDAITSVHVQKFVDHYGAKFPVRTNHERALLSIIYNWGKARGYCTIGNPVTAVKQIKTEPGGRYVDHDDYWAFYDYLIARGHQGHAAAMAISYLCGSRQQDVLALLRNKPRRPQKEDSYLTDDGLVIWQQKTGKVQLKEWNDDLRAVVQLALGHNVKKVKHITQAPSRYVLTGRTGNGFTRGGFNSTWTRRQGDAEKAGIISARFSFHDMKIKALSDFEGDDRANFSGHKTRGMAERYNRTPDKVSALRQPKRKKD